MPTATARLTGFGSGAVFGGTVPAQTWKAFMRPALDGLAGARLPRARTAPTSGPGRGGRHVIRPEVRRPNERIRPRPAVRLRRAVHQDHPAHRSTTTDHVAAIHHTTAARLVAPPRRRRRAVHDRTRRHPWRPAGRPGLLPGDLPDPPAGGLQSELPAAPVEPEPIGPDPGQATGQTVALADEPAAGQAADRASGQTVDQAKPKGRERRSEWRRTEKARRYAARNSVRFPIFTRSVLLWMLIFALVGMAFGASGAFWWAHFNTQVSELRHRHPGLRDPLAVGIGRHREAEERRHRPRSTPPWSRSRTP